MRGASTEKAKQALRRRALARRSSLSDADSRSLSRAIQARALQLSGYLARDSVALYSAIQNEVRTDDLLEHALRSGKKVFYPRTGVGDEAGFFRVFSPGELRAGRFGILEPGGSNRLADGEWAALTVFVPGLAFDARGHRLGRGQGWYDRMLQKAGYGAALAALAYEFQIVESVPSDPWDRNVHHVITERRIIDCESASTQSRQVW